MRPLVVSLACASLAACAGPALPPATERVASAGPVVAADGVTYWVEYTSDGLTLTRYLDDNTAAIDSAPPGVPVDLVVSVLVVGADAIGWGYTGDFTGCGRLRVVFPDGTRRARENASLTCQGTPLAETDGHVLLLEQDGSVVSVDLATSAVTALFDAGDVMLAGAPVSDGQSIYGLFWNEDGMFVGEMALADPRDLWVVAPGVRGGLGLAVHGDELYWIDRGYDGEAPVLYSVASSATEAHDVAPVADLAVDPRSLAGACDTLWVADADDQALVRIGPHGTADRFPTPYIPMAITALPDRLFVTAFAENDRQQLAPLLEQPLP